MNVLLLGRQLGLSLLHHAVMRLLVSNDPSTAIATRTCSCRRPLHHCLDLTLLLLLLLVLGRRRGHDYSGCLLGMYRTLNWLLLLLLCLLSDRHSDQLCLLEVIITNNE